MRSTTMDHSKIIGAFAVAVLALGLAGCGGSETTDDGGSVASGEVASGEVESDSSGSAREELPDGFPEDVPLPDFTSAKPMPPPSGSTDTWSAVLVLGAGAETPVEDYAGQLTEAGYSVEDGLGGSKDATGPQWSVSFHSSYSGMLSITVSAE